MLALSLPLLHLSWSPFTDRIPAAANLAAEIALGVSMLLVALDEARMRTRRLRAVQAIAASMASAQQYGNVVQSAVEELHRLTGVRAAWFRLLEGGHLVATHAVGLSADFLRDAGFAAINDDITKLLQQPGPQVTTKSADSPEPQESPERGKRFASW